MTHSIYVELKQLAREAVDAINDAISALGEYNIIVK